MSNRFGLKIIAVILAMFTWTYVNLVIPPQSRRTLKTDIVYRNKPELMKITPDHPKVQIEIEGLRSDFILAGLEKV